ncbi:MAG: amidohydrolase [Phycisphaerales bacterium]|nr:amidohydrolase [Phycisphaerales bacterium]
MPAPDALSTAAPRFPADKLRALIREELARVIHLRHDLHAHPELAYQERRTAGVVAAELSSLGIRHKSGLAGGTGVIAYLPPTDPADESRPAVALRADMDALPIEERTGATYASRTPGLMHACGHDGHTANLLGVARVLNRLPHRPRGTLLIFQPAEEGGAGGERLCEEGVLKGETGGGGGLGAPVGQIFGLHGWPQFALGTVGSREGPLLAATDNFTVKLVGTQAHAAYPHLSGDPVVAAAHIITALQTIASRNAAPQDSIVVTVAQINAGTASNIIPRELTFIGTMRTVRQGTRDLGKKRFFEIVEGTARALGARAQIEWEEGYPVTHNDPAMTDKFFRVAVRALGDARVQEVPEPTMGGEDFSYYGRHVPACFFVLGVKPADRADYPSLHQPEYDFNDDALPTGIEVMCRLALED